MEGNSDYSKLVVQAEKAVTGVQDPDLKRIAFQKILETLLAADGSERQPAEKIRSNTSKSSKKPSRGGPKAYIEELLADGFFKSPKTIALVKSELENSGHRIATTSLSGPLQTLCQDKKLRRKKDQTSGMYSYSNW
jgi:hypothetical protein